MITGYKKEIELRRRARVRLVKAFERRGIDVNKAVCWASGTKLLPLTDGFAKGTQWHYTLRGLKQLWRAMFPKRPRKVRDARSLLADILEGFDKKDGVCAWSADEIRAWANAVRKELER